MLKQRSALDKTIAIAGIAYLAISVWAVIMPEGQMLPPAGMLATVAAMAALLLAHMFKHLDWKLMAAFVAVASVIEWAFEQINIMHGGFIWGDLRYGNYTIFSVHLGSVPIAVPLCMAVILWPTYAAVNLALDGRVVVNPHDTPWWQNVWRCVLYGFVHSWLMFMCNDLCVKHDLYRWVGHSAQRQAQDMFLGDPAAPTGWLIYVFITMLAFTFVMVPWLGRDAMRRAGTQRLDWTDGAPILFWAVMAVQNFLSAVNNPTVANVVMWTMGFFAVFTGYRFVTIMRAQRSQRSADSDQTFSADPTLTGSANNIT
ncbi:hypothetical protein F0Q45_07945 [Mycobacterium simiae]|uniref:Uncharacterized protein n=1 Tax=Mycobacterium simiae TaxID=1784 RepID=A0A5B1BRR6_MYCSI|nr:hypothetical protein [Mycobacterium simiae]KAA1250752.1 hypothetical protein F0Q45_07945 [Mycobacterium simiae]